MKKTLLSIVAVLALIGALAFVGHSAVSAQTDDTAGTIVGGGDDSGLTATPADSAGGDIVILLHQLTAIQLDLTLFTGPMFQSLRDYSVPVTPEAVSRVNPFAPIGQTQ